jgi:hypothetical protein
MVALATVDQLNRDTHAFARFANATVEQGIDAEPSADFARVHARAAKSEGGSARRNMKFAELGQGVKDFLRDSVGKILLVAFGAEIGKR